MPRLSDSMDEGTIVRWLKSTGEQVAAGEELVEIETDKATMSYEAETSGQLTIVAAEGQTLPVGAIIGQIGSNGAQAETDHGRDRATRAKASPLARRLAKELGVEVATLRGTGPSGRIVKRDIEAAAPQAAPAPTPEPPPRPGVRPDGLKGDVELRPATSVQSTIARRMAQSKSTAPDFTLTTEVGMDAAIELRAQLDELGLDRLPSLNDFVIKACAGALRRHPRVNSSYTDDGFETYGRVNIGVAVAAPDALLVPTIFDADQKSLSQIATETRALAERGRAGKLTPAELSGGTFTVSNLGMFGITQFAAVINPPQAAILAVGSVEDRVAFRDEVPVPARRMNLTITCDHRILYGADAAAFLQSVRGGLEKPLGLLL
jgi:pyruvate dehydrogenase E2 component (dihydrolipoamide acetyltransferase)